MIYGKNELLGLFIILHREKRWKIGNIALKPGKKFWARDIELRVLGEAEDGWSQELLGDTPRLCAQVCSLVYFKFGQKNDRKWQSERESGVTQSCPTLCDPVDCSLWGSSVHGIFQAIVLKWIAIPFSRGSSQPRDWTQLSRIVDRRFTVWAPREATRKW